MMDDQVCLIPEPPPHLVQAADVFTVLHVLLLAGHIDRMASSQSHMSELVGCLFGHLIVDHALPCSHCERISVLTLPPNAVSTSDRKSTWRKTRT